MPCWSSLRPSWRLQNTSTHPKAGRIECRFQGQILRYVRRRSMHGDTRADDATIEMTLEMAEKAVKAAQAKESGGGRGTNVC